MSNSHSDDDNDDISTSDESDDDHRMDDTESESESSESDDENNDESNRKMKMKMENVQPCDTYNHKNDIKKDNNNDKKLKSNMNHVYNSFLNGNVPKSINQEYTGESVDFLQDYYNNKKHSLIDSDFTDCMAEDPFTKI